MMLWRSFSVSNENHWHNKEGLQITRNQKIRVIREMRLPRLPRETVVAVVSLGFHRGAKKKSVIPNNDNKESLTP